MKKHYQKYCMHLAYAIISTSSFLFTTKSFSQENNSLSISESTNQYMKDKDLKLWPILHDTIIETKRPILFLDDKIFDDNEIIGSYSMKPTKYLFARRDDRKGDYIKNELVDILKTSIIMTSLKSFIAFIKKILPINYMQLKKVMLST